MSRIILHVDFDSFYAQLEVLRRPELKGKPIVICMQTSRGEDSGAVATASYEARKLGIHSAMPIKFAKSRASNSKEEVIFLPADRKYYVEVSNKLMDLLESFSDSFEQVSIDEAYLDIAGRANGNYTKAKEIAEKIKRKIKREKLTCSVGIGPNKLIAKMAANMEKPNGLTIIEEKDAKKFFKPFPIGKLFSVGPKTEEKLKQMGIETIGDLAKCEEGELVRTFGERRAKELLQFSQAKDDREVSPRIKQQFSRISTLKEDTKDLKEINKLLKELSKDVAKNLKKEKAKSKTITFIAIASFFSSSTRSKTLESETDSSETISQMAIQLAQDFLSENDLVLRRIGVSCSNLIRKDDKKETKKRQRNLGEF